MIIRLEYKHLERVFDLVMAITTENKQLNTSSIKILESIINAQVLNQQNDRRTKRKRTHSGAKEERKDKTGNQ